MRATPLTISIILLLLVVAVYYYSCMEGFETLAQKVSDRFNPLAGLQNPLTNPAVRIGISKADAETLREMNIRALNVSKVTPGSSIVETFSDLIYPRIDDETTYLGLIKMCKDKGVGDRPFDDPKFAEVCGMCVTSGSLKTGETFTTPIGVLVYPEDKLAAMRDKASNGYPFPPAVPSIDAAVCKGASKTSIGEPSLAITQADFDGFKARMECRRSHGLGNGCAKCIITKESSWISPTGGIKSLTLFLYGVGSLVVEIGGKVVSDANAVLSAKPTQVSLGKAAEGTSLNITVSKGVGTEDPYVYGIMMSKTPSNTPYVLSIEKMLETDRVSGTFIRKGEPMVLPEAKTAVSKLLPHPTKTSMSLVGFIPLTLVEGDELAAYDCKTGPYVSSAASAELFISDPCLNPRGQAPGNYSVECRRAAILNAGCSTNGEWYKDPGYIPAGPHSIEEYTKQVRAFKERSKDPSVSKGCLGIDTSTPCDAYKNGGMPDERCIKYLYSNTSEYSNRIGRAYDSANTKFTSRQEKQFQFCQPSGSLNPASANGLATLASAAGGYDGLSGIEAIRKFLSDIFMKATSDLDVNTPDSEGGRKDSWEKCIGLPIADVEPGKISLNSTGGVLVNQSNNLEEYSCQRILDHGGDNIRCMPEVDSYIGNQVKEACNLDPNCKGYNTVLRPNGKHGGCLKSRTNLTIVDNQVTEFCVKNLPNTVATEYNCRALDHDGDDIICVGGHPSYMGNDMKEACNTDPNCKGYNTTIWPDGTHGGCLKYKTEITRAQNPSVKEFCVKKLPNEPEQKAQNSCLFRASGQNCSNSVACKPGSRCDIDSRRGGMYSGRCVTCDSSCNGQCQYVDGVYGRLAS